MQSAKGCLISFVVYFRKKCISIPKLMKKRKVRLCVAVATVYRPSLILLQEEVLFLLRPNVLDLKLKLLT